MDIFRVFNTRPKKEDIKVYGKNSSKPKLFPVRLPTPLEQNPFPDKLQACPKRKALGELDENLRNTRSERSSERTAFTMVQYKSGISNAYLNDSDFINQIISNTRPDMISMSSDTICLNLQSLSKIDNERFAELILNNLNISIEDSMTLSTEQLETLQRCLSDQVRSHSSSTRTVSDLDDVEGGSGASDDGVSAGVDVIGHRPRPLSVPLSCSMSVSSSDTPLARSFPGSLHVVTSDLRFPPRTDLGRDCESPFESEPPTLCASGSSTGSSMCHSRFDFTPNSNGMVLASKDDIPSALTSTSMSGSSSSSCYRGKTGNGSRPRSRQGHIHRSSSFGSRDSISDNKVSLKTISSGDLDIEMARNGSDDQEISKQFMELGLKSDSVRKTALGVHGQEFTATSMTMQGTSLGVEDESQAEHKTDLDDDENLLHTHSHEAHADIEDEPTNSVYIPTRIISSEVQNRMQVVAQARVVRAVRSVTFPPICEQSVLSPVVPRSPTILPTAAAISNPVPFTATAYSGFSQLSASKQVKPSLGPQEEVSTPKAEKVTRSATLPCAMTASMNSTAELSMGNIFLENRKRSREETKLHRCASCPLPALRDAGLETPLPAPAPTVGNFRTPVRALLSGSDWGDSTPAGAGRLQHLKSMVEAVRNKTIPSRVPASLRSPDKCETDAKRPRSRASTLEYLRVPLQRNNSFHSGCNSVDNIDSLKTSFLARGSNKIKSSPFLCKKLDGFQNSSPSSFQSSSSPRPIGNLNSSRDFDNNSSQSRVSSISSADSETTLETVLEESTPLGDDPKSIEKRKKSESIKKRTSSLKQKTSQNSPSVLGSLRVGHIRNVKATLSGTRDSMSGLASASGTDLDGLLVDDTGMSFTVEEEGECAEDFGDHAMDVVDANLSGYSKAASHRQEDLTGLNALSFAGVVIGGIYRHWWQGFMPVILPPSNASKRVNGIRILDDGSCEVLLFLPKDNVVKVINLGPKWRWIRASPDGYLLAKGPFEVMKIPIKSNEKHCKVPAYTSPSSRRPCYFLRSSTESSFSLEINSIHSMQSDDNVGMEGCGCDYSARMDSMSSQLLSPLPIPAKCPRQGGDDQCISRHVHHDGEGSELMDTSDIMTSPHSEYDRTVLSMDRSQDDAAALFDDDYDGVAEEMTEVTGTLLDWTRSVVITHVLLFLVCNDRKSSIVNENSNKKSMIGSSSVIDPKEEQLNLLLICKSWSLGSYKLLANQLSYNTTSMYTMNFQEYSRFMSRYNTGKLLGQGACKNVYCVPTYGMNGQGNKNEFMDAVSVMDVEDLIAKGMQVAVTRDLEISMICSSLVTMNICPNLVRVHSMFQSEYPVPDSWKNKRVKSKHVALTENLPKGLYQYIRMEFCTGGDLEEYLRKNSIDTDSLRYMLFQLCFSLYCCRDLLSLRHFDLKLLNVLVTDPMSALFGPMISSRKALSGDNVMFTQDVKNIRLEYGLEEHKFYIPMSTTSKCVLKLTDFGTSVMGDEALGAPITIEQFTTLENTPPEYLMMGSTARQSYTGDTFCLGLSFLHLLTEKAPYEELLEQVRCPVYLAKRLSSIWESTHKESPYKVIIDVLDTLADDSEAPKKSALSDARYYGRCAVFCDTLYRYLVLFGMPEEDTAGNDGDWSNNPVWNAVISTLRVSEYNDNSVTDDGAKKNRQGRKKIGKDEREIKQKCAERFCTDRSSWSLEYGSNKDIARARERLHSLYPAEQKSAAMKMFLSMVHFNPAKRCSLLDLLMSPIFESLRSASSSDCNDDSIRRFEYLHYFRSTEGRKTISLGDNARTAISA